MKEYKEAMSMVFILKKSKHILSLVLSFYLLVLFLSIVEAATGSITITEPPSAGIYYTDGSFIIRGTYIMTEDDSPSGIKTSGYPASNCKYNIVKLSPGYWDIFQWVGTHAEVHYKIDGVYKGRIGEVNWVNCCPRHDWLGEEIPFSIFINTSRMRPGTEHTVTIYMQDIYGAQCWYGRWWGDPFPVRGDVFAETTLTFKICSNIDKDGDGHYLPDSCYTPADDCDDNDPTVYPGAPEVCDGKDNNCNGEVDEGLSTDADGDGHYTPDSCLLPNDDCDDSDPTVYPGATEVCDGKDNDCDGEADEGCGCDVEVRVSPLEVYPLGTSGDSEADIVALTNSPASSGGCTIRLSVEGEPYTGGHEHNGSRSHGQLSADVIRFQEGEYGIRSVKYRASEVSGIDRIEAVLEQTGQRWEFEVRVRVPGLYEMASGSSYRLTGATTTHPENHYGKHSTIVLMRMIADEYYAETGTTLGINDMSLPWGGLFDVSGNWSTPHISHREGKDVDIDRYVYDPETSRYILRLCTSDKIFKEIVKTYHGKPICESGGRKHIRF